MEEACGPTPKDFFDTNQDHEMVYAVIEYLIKQGVLDLARHWRWKSKSIVALPTPTSLVPEALSLSARSGKLNILEALVDEYPDVEVTRLLNAAVESNDPDVVEFVLSLGILLDHSDMTLEDAFEVLEKAMSYSVGDVGDVLSVLVDRGLELNATSWRRLSTLVSRLTTSNSCDLLWSTSIPTPRPTRL